MTVQLINGCVARLLVRSYWHFVRFEIDSLYYALRDADQTKARVIGALLGERFQGFLSLEFSAV